MCCEQVYEALNSMGETAWGINPKVLEQVQHAYQDLKGGFCGLPLHESVEDAPLPTQPPQRFRTDVYKGQLTARVSCPTIVCADVHDHPCISVGTVTSWTAKASQMMGSVPWPRCHPA